jgi:hypothetical protein
MFYSSAQKTASSWHKNQEPYLTANSYFKIHNRIILLNELLAYSDKLYSKDRDEYEKTYKMGVESAVEDIADIFIEQEKETEYYISYDDDDDDYYGDDKEKNKTYREKFEKYKEFGRKIMRDSGFKYV